MFAQLGCLGALQREGLLRNLSGLAGASAGAMSGAALASGKVVLHPSTPAALHSDMNVLREMKHRRWESLDPTLGPGILKGVAAEAILRPLYAETFDELKIPFACSAWSCSGLVTLTKGSVVSAVRASFNIPIILWPARHGKRWLFDGGIGDPSGGAGLRDLPQKPRRAMHIIVNRKMLPGFDHYWTRLRGPSQFAVSRQEVLTIRLNRPPSLLLGQQSFDAFPDAVLATAQAVLDVLDEPLRPGTEDGHWILEVDVGWSTRNPHSVGASLWRTVLFVMGGILLAALFHSFVGDRDQIGHSLAKLASQDHREQT